MDFPFWALRIEHRGGSRCFFCIDFQSINHNQQKKQQKKSMVCCLFGKRVYICISKNSKRKTKNIMENSQNNVFLTGPNKMQIAVLDGKTIRKFIKHLKKLGATISINRPNHKNVTDSDGYRIFSALKYSNGWDCRVALNFVDDLKNIIG